MSDSLQPHESQHTRPPCPLPTPRVYSNSCPSSRWCHPAISSSVVPFSSCPQSLPVSGSFPMSQLFTWTTLHYMWKSMREVNLKRSQLKKNCFSISFMLCLYEMTDVQSTSCWNHFMMYVGQITVLYSLTPL